jgi:hypothetical protein
MRQTNNSNGQSRLCISFTLKIKVDFEQIYAAAAAATFFGTQPNRPFLLTNLPPVTHPTNQFDNTIYRYCTVLFQSSDGRDYKSS